MDEILKRFISEKFYECRSVEYGKNTDKSLYFISLRGLNGRDVKISIRDNGENYAFILSTVKSINGFFPEEIQKKEFFTTGEELQDLLDKYFSKESVAISNKKMFDIFAELEEYLGKDNIKRSVVVENHLKVFTDTVNIEVYRVRDAFNNDPLNKVNCNMYNTDKDNKFHVEWRDCAVDEVVGKIKQVIPYLLSSTSSSSGSTEG